MMLKKWEDMPDNMRTEAVKPYYDLLSRRKGSLLIKRVFDVVVSFIMIILLSPVLLFLSIWIKTDSKGPVLFKQERVTQYGRSFRVLKFRTMVDKAESLGEQITKDRDPRITKAGSKLRDLRLDELPQLFNVLAGDMSFVGTRPEVPKFVNEYTDEMMATLLLPAGVTSRASIEFKDEDELLNSKKDVFRAYCEDILPRKMEINLRAIEDFSFIEDIKTMFKTVGAVLGH